MLVQPIQPSSKGRGGQKDGPATAHVRKYWHAYTGGAQGRISTQNKMEAQREKKNEILRDDEKSHVFLRGKTAAFPPIYRLWSLKENSGNVACTQYS